MQPLEIKLKCGMDEPKFRCKTDKDFQITV